MCCSKRFFSTNTFRQTPFLDPRSAHLPKPGTIEISGNWLGDSSQTALSDLAQAGTVAAWKITAPVQGLTKTFTATGSGFVTKFDVGPFEKNKPQEFTATVQMTGSYVASVA